MEIFKIENIELFAFLFLPGFISVKIQHLIVANDKYDFSKNLLEIVGYSLINLIINSWLIFVNIKFGWYEERSFYLYLSLLYIMILAPTLYPFIIKRLLEMPYFKRHFLGDTKSAWDFYFSKREPSWIIVTLKNGRRLGGKFGASSYASCYPCKESIYIEELWQLDESGIFLKKEDRTKGFLIVAESIEMVQFIE